MGISVLCIYAVSWMISWCIVHEQPGNSSFLKETENSCHFFRQKVSQKEKKKLVLFATRVFCVNCGDVSFSVSSRNHFTAVQFLMEIKSIQQKSSCLPLFGSLFPSALWGKKNKGRDTTLRKKNVFHIFMYPKRLLMHCLMLSDGEKINKKSTKNAKC